MTARPAELEALFAAQGGSAREEAWAAFVDRYTPLLLHAASSVRPGYDGAMDRFAYLLDQLRRDDFRRLRQFDPDGRAGFPTWLVVVARRLCIDFHRQRYGRAAASTRSRDTSRSDRWRLQELAGDSDDLASIADSGLTITREYTARERLGALAKVLEALESTDRMLVQLRYEREMTAKEIAGVIGFLSQAQVYRRLEIVLARLRSELELAGIESPWAA